MKYIFLFLICTSSYTFAGSFDWLSSMFLGKQYHAAHAYQHKNYEQSLETFHDLMNKDPYNPEYNYNVGDILYRQKKYHDAQQAFLRTVKHAPQTSKLTQQAYFNLGNSCYQLEEWQQAVDAYQQVLNMHAGHKQAQHNLELALYKLQQQLLQDQEQAADENQEQSNQKQDQSCQQQKQQSQGGQPDNQSQGSSEKKPGEIGEQDTSQVGQDDAKSSNKQQNGQSDDGDKDAHQNTEQQGQNQSTGQNQQHNKQSQAGKDGQEKLNTPNLSDPSELESQASLDNQGLDNNLDKQESGDAKQLGDQAQSGEESKQPGDQAGLDKEGVQQTDVHTQKKIELKNQLKDQYESKASQDERLSEYHASVMKTLEDLEEKIQKHVIKNKVAMQGSGHNEKKGW